jgi:DNA-directed RNA polymerase subunit beta'
VGRLIPAGTGLAYHNERRRRRQEERELESEPQGARVEMAAEELEQALKQALNTSEAGG